MNTVAALYLGGPLHGQIHQIPADGRRQQHVETVENPQVGYFDGEDAWKEIQTKLTRYVLRDDLFEPTVLCVEGAGEQECLEWHDAWRQDAPRARIPPW